MKVKLLEPRAAADGAQNRGDEIDVSAAEGKRMIDAGQAVPVRGAAKTAEKTVAADKAEKAVK